MKIIFFLLFREDVDGRDEPGHDERIQHLNPALQFTQHQLPDHVHAGLAVVQARDEGKLLAAIVLENLGVFLRDLFQRLQAVGDEARTDHVDAPGFGAAEFFQGRCGRSRSWSKRCRVSSRRSRGSATTFSSSPSMVGLC